MTEKGWNPGRRNRNIGTAKQGYGQDNKLCIPQPLDTLKCFYERFDELHTEYISIHGRQIPALVEKLKGGYFYSCGPADAERLLNELPEEDLEDFGLLVFRQPKKKESIISSVWGRLIYSFQYRDDLLPAIILESTQRCRTFTFPKKQDEESKMEFKLLQEDGLQFKLGKRNYEAPMNEQLTRNIQLYRTLLHEVGHYVHYLESVQRPGSEHESCEQWEKRNELYFALPRWEKEAFANKYAVKYKKLLMERKVIPFDFMTLSSEKRIYLKR